MKSENRMNYPKGNIYRKYPAWIIIILLLFAGIQPSRESKPDSITTGITNIPVILRDSLLSPGEKFIIVKRIAALYQNSYPQKALSYNKLTITMAKSRKDTQSLINARFYLAENYHALSRYSKADSLYKIVTHTDQVWNKEKQAVFLCRVADNYYSWSRYKKAAEYYTKSRNLYELLGIKSGIAATLKGEGKVWANYNDYARSIGLFQRAYDIYQQLDDKEGLASIDSQLGMVMENWGKLKRAESFYISAFNIYHEKNDLFNETSMHLHLGKIQQKQGAYSKALNYYQKAKTDAEKINSDILYAVALNNIAEAYYELKQYDVALRYQQQALPLEKKVGDRRRIAITMLDLGKIFYKKGQLNRAIQYSDSTLLISKEIKTKNLLLDTYLLLSNISKKKNDYLKAYTYLTYYNQIHQEIFTDKNRQIVSEMEVQLEAEKKEKENEILRKQDKLSQTRLAEEKSTRLILIIFISFFVLTALVVLIYIQYKNKIIKTNYGLLAARNQKITEQTERLTKLNNALSTSREQYRSIVENATIGMYQTTPGGKVMFANKTLLHMLGYSLSELKLANLNKAKPKRQHFINLIEKQGIITGREDVWEHADGSKIYVKESAWAICDKDNKTLYYEGIIEDISKRKQAEEMAEKRKGRLQKINTELHKRNIEIRVAKNQAEEANRAKSLFIANISHEIRTPLNSIIGFTDLLIPMAKDQKEKAFLKSIENSSNNLLSLINDILDLSKIQAGKLELYAEPVSICSIITGIQQIFYPQREKKKIRFITRISPILDGKFLLDTTRFRQILFNLVGNAIKFTDKGYVKLTASGHITDGEGKYYDLEIAVEDTGSGIPEIEQKIIFEAFKQSSESLSHQRQGTGLGLSITKRLVKAMNGDITLKSKPGKGTIITILLRKVEKVQKAERSRSKEVSGQTITQYCQKDKQSAFIQISTDVRRDFSDKFFHTWEAIVENKVVDDIIAFGNEVSAFGKEKHINIIQKTGKQLVEASNYFEIETIELLLLQIKSFF